MKIIAAVLKDIYIYFKPTSKIGIIRFTILVFLLSGLYYFVIVQGASEAPKDVEQSKIVYVGTVSSIMGEDKMTVIGSVASKNQAIIKAEAAGRITRVPVTLGQKVYAGQILATIENASQYASLLQAQGQYEAALVSASKSNLSVEQAETDLTIAKNNVLNAYKDAFLSFRSIVQLSLDDVFSNRYQSVYDLLITGGIQTDFLTDERGAFDVVIDEWAIQSNSITNDTDIETEVQNAIAYLTRLNTLLDVLIDRIDKTDPGSRFSQDALDALSASYEANRVTVNGQISGLRATLTTLKSSEEKLQQAEFGSTNTELSSANAQVKQALGTLRAAEANYEKSIIRTPIAGTLNELSVKVGDYVNQFAPAALVANNAALEVTAFIGENDVSRVFIDQKVLLDATVEGTVTAIAPAIDTLTRKIEVKIGSESEALKNGDTVSVQFIQNTEEIKDNTPLRVPITAVKFTATDGSMFVVENGMLVSVPVVLGPITGSFVTIESGITASTTFVIDARGLTEGQEVETLRK